MLALAICGAELAARWNPAPEGDGNLRQEQSLVTVGSRIGMLRQQ